MIIKLFVAQRTPMGIWRTWSLYFPFSSLQQEPHAKKPKRRPERSAVKSRDPFASFTKANSSQKKAPAPKRKGLFQMFNKEPFDQ